VSDLDLDVVDTSAKPYLAGRHKPDLTFVLRFIADIVPLIVTELLAVDVAEAKGRGVCLDNDTVKGQGAVYGLELWQSRPVGGPVTVPLLSPEQLMFLQVDGTFKTVVESDVLSWLPASSTPNVACGLTPLIAFILESTSRARERVALTGLVEGFVLVRRLGSGASSTVYEAVRGEAGGGGGGGGDGGGGEGGGGLRYAVKVFDEEREGDDVGDRCAVEALVLSPGTAPYSVHVPWMPSCACVFVCVCVLTVQWRKPGTAFDLASGSRGG
jgi:hypothetical protein